MPTVLCVDDEPGILKLRGMVLESAGYAVLLARNGPEALALFTARAPGLVVLDYLMPEMHGGIVAAEMRRLSPHVPIVFLSGCLSIPERDLAMVDAFVTKGDPPSALLAVLKRLLSRRQQKAAAAAPYRIS